MGGVKLRSGKGALRHERSSARSTLGRKLARIAGRRHFRPGLVGTDQLLPLSRIVARQYGLDRYVDHARVAEIGLAVGEGELHRLRDAMQVASGVVAELAQLGGLEEVHRLQQRWPLAPGPASIELDVAERGLGRLVESRMIAREILGRQDAAILLLELYDGARDIASIERVARCRETGLASA